MAWQIKDEWIDLAQARHVVVFHNPDVLVPPTSGVGKHVPVEHHLIHEFKLASCPHCGHVKTDDQGESVDFLKVKADIHAALNAHYGTLMQYRELHPGVRIGNGPKA